MMSAEPLEITLFSSYSKLTLSAKVWGSQNAIKVLGVHGWMDNAATWDGIGHLMAEKGIHFVSVDLPGHGLSQHRPSAPYNFFDYIPDLMSVAKQLNWGKYSLLGHSLGAAISSILASIDFNVKKLVMVEGFGPWSAPPSSSHDILMKSIQQAHDFSGKQPNIYANLEEAMNRLKINNPTLASHSVKTLVSRGTRPLQNIDLTQDIKPEGSVQFRHDIRLRISPPFRLSEDQVFSFFKNIKCPTLFILAKDGEKTLRDVIFPHRKQWIPNLQYRIVEGHHHVHLDSPDRVANDIIDFLLGQQPSVPFLNNNLS